MIVCIMNIKEKYLFIGNELKQLRKEANLTQAKLAELLGVTETTISLWENNKVKTHQYGWEGIKQKILTISSIPLCTKYKKNSIV